MSTMLLIEDDDHFRKTLANAHTERGCTVTQAPDGERGVRLTSYAMVGDRQRCLVAGCTGYIEKPINPDTFLKEIEEYLKARPAGGEVQP